MGSRVNHLSLGSPNSAYRNGLAVEESAEARQYAKHDDVAACRRGEATHQLRPTDPTEPDLGIKP